jgi:hypothetical protein
MRSDGILRHLIFAFIIAVVFYVVVFGWIEHRRVFKGPWIVAFETDGQGRPSLVISEPKLNISQTVTFPTQKIAGTRLHQGEQFDEAVTNLPFGSMVFQDPTFLPGTVMMNLFGHQVQLLPRILTIDKKEIPWRTGQTNEVR